jgi:hypothetical protein
MSKNNKNRRLHQDAKVRNRAKGYKGPARTTKLNTKKATWWRKLSTKPVATAAQTILDGAGAAAE